MNSNSNIQKPLALTWAQVDLKAIAHNIREIKRVALPQHAGKKTQRVNILAVVKADAYGHGMLKVASLLDRLGVDFFGVSDVPEGILLRKNGIKKPVLLFESTLVSFPKEIVEYNLTPTVCTLPLAQALNRYAKLKHKKIDVHVKVDTGMGRLGIWHKDATEFIKKIMQLPNLSIKGIYTHFPSADTDKRFTQEQIKQLRLLVKQLDKMGLIVPYIHAANSMGLAGYKIDMLNLARAGLMIYGLYPSSSLKSKIKLRPALSVRSKVIFLKKISKGRSISYGRTFIAKKNMTVATIPIGYNDGYWRSFSNNASVLVGGKRCPILGRVTMDQVMVDVTKVSNVRLGEESVILGRQGREEITADELAHLSSTINYEVVCSLGNRLARVYKY